MRPALALLVVGMAVGCAPSTQSPDVGLLRQDLGALRWSPAEPADQAETYRVERGDTLWSIARRWGVSVAELKQANGLRSDTIRAGQTLVIPGAGWTRSLAEAHARTGENGFLWPVPGSRQAREQDGALLIYAPEGSEVVAAGPGRVSYVSERVRGEGAVVMLEHADGLLTMYGRLGEVTVTGGEQVRQGQELGRVGPGGPKSGPRVSFRVFREGRAAPASEYVRP